VQEVEFVDAELKDKKVEQNLAIKKVSNNLMFYIFEELNVVY